MTAPERPHGSDDLVEREGTTAGPDVRDNGHTASELTEGGDADRAGDVLDRPGEPDHLDQGPDRGEQPPAAGQELAAGEG